MPSRPALPKTNRQNQTAANQGPPSLGPGRLPLMLRHNDLGCLAGIQIGTKTVGNCGACIAFREDELRGRQRRSVPLGQALEGADIGLAVARVAEEVVAG